MDGMITTSIRNFLVAFLRSRQREISLRKVLFIFYMHPNEHKRSFIPRRRAQVPFRVLAPQPISPAIFLRNLTGDALADRVQTGRLFVIPLLLLLFFLIIPAGPAFSGQTMILNTANAPPNATQNFSGIGDRVLTEAFRRLDIRLKISRLPSERALYNANAGIDDGNYARVAGLNRLYPNLIQVPEPICRFGFVAVSKSHNFQTVGWRSLMPYNVGIITGWKILEQNIAGAKSLTRLKDRYLLFNMLLADRVDLIVYDRKQAAVLLKQIKAAERLTILEPPLATSDMYPYLHRKHHHLVTPLAEALQTMKTDGSYNRIVEEVMASYTR